MCNHGPTLCRCIVSQVLRLFVVRVPAQHQRIRGADGFDHERTPVFFAVRPRCVAVLAGGSASGARAVRGNPGVRGTGPVHRVYQDAALPRHPLHGSRQRGGRFGRAHLDHTVTAEDAVAGSRVQEPALPVNDPADPDGLNVGPPDRGAFACRVGVRGIRGSGISRAVGAGFLALGHLGQDAVVGYSCHRGLLPVGVGNNRTSSEGRSSLRSGEWAFAAAPVGPIPVKQSHFRITYCNV